jgi:hypothetical protein
MAGTVPDMSVGPVADGDACAKESAQSGFLHPTMSLGGSDSLP